MKCDWVIEVPAGQTVTITSDYFDLQPGMAEYNGYCYYQSLGIIADYIASGYGSWTHYCGRTGPSIIIKGARYIHLTFDVVKESVDKYKGFKISYKFGSDPEVTTTTRPTTQRPTTTATMPPTTATILPGSCGVPDIHPLTGNRIVGGIEAKPHSWPWMVKMYGVGCGGTLIDRQWVLSAAHCFQSIFGARKYSVGLGFHSPSYYDLNTQIIQVAKVIVHESYNRRNHDNDVALLKLEKPADVTGHHVKPACLPEADVPDGKICYVTGWGRTQGTSNHGNLKQAAIPIVNRDVCNRQNNGLITDNMICAAYPEGGHDSCQGDSGGPFVCKSDTGVWEVQGVVSWGYGCAVAGKPGVYARVTKYNAWIREKMANN